MPVIVPTIMTETLEEYQASFERVQPFARRIHVDLSDGEFAPTYLLGIDQITWPEGYEIDVHAMVSRPSEHLAQIVQRKPALVILHAEAQEDIVPHLNFLKNSGIKAGVALLKSTVPSTIEEIIKLVDHVMVFSGELGKFGGEASLMQLEKVRLIKAINPSVEIGWDGGVNVDNAYMLAQGGVDVLNAGGAINKAVAPAEAYNELVKEINKHGVI